MRGFVQTLVAACVATALTGSGWGQDLQLELGRSDEWRFNVTPYAWLAGMDGDVTVRGRETDVDVGFDEILDALDFGAIGHFEAGKGDWTAMFDLVFLQISADGDTPGPLISDVDVEMQTLILEVGGAYRVYEKEEGIFNRPTALAILGGVRYTDLEADVDLTSLLPLPDVDGSRDWVDPFIGFRTGIQWTPRFASSFRFDIGGFGVGSDLVYQLTSMHAVAMTEKLDLVFGYRRLTYDYEDDSGANEFEFDATLAGPIIGVNIGF